jgi:AraC family transcriptional regulator of arabinose operon
MQNHTEELFAGSAPAVVTSERVLYTPSGFARTSLGYLQEIGTLKVHRPHTAGRKNLTSFLFFTVTEGCGELTYEGKTYVLKKGDCIFIDCRKEYIQSTGRQLWSLAWIHFYGPNMTAIYDKYLERGGRVVFHPVYISEYLALHQRIFALAKSDDHIRDMKINSELDQLLVLLMSESWNPKKVKGTNLKKQNVLPIKEYLDVHYQEKISLDFLAEHFFISKYYLTRVFKEQFGTSINSYLMNRRVTRAKFMLRFSGEKIEAIGYTCGLGAPHYFSRIFKQMEGTSPSEYRERWQQESNNV